MAQEAQDFQGHRAVTPLVKRSKTLLGDGGKKSIERFRISP